MKGFLNTTSSKERTHTHTPPQKKTYTHNKNSHNNNKKRQEIVTEILTQLTAGATRQDKEKKKCPSKGEYWR